MNIGEFKAWFEGFTESLDGPPGEKAWKKIQAKVKDIKDSPPTSYPVFVDRYVRPYQHDPHWTDLSGRAGSLGSVSGDAFRDLGRMDARTGNS